MLSALVCQQIATLGGPTTVVRFVASPTLADRMEAALDELRPALRADGGDVWFVRADAGVAYVQMIGACGGCPMSNATLRGGIEVAVLRHCPEIVRVEQL